MFYSLTRRIFSNDKNYLLFFCEFKGGQLRGKRNLKIREVKIYFKIKSGNHD